MAATGKKINELTAISSITDETVVPAVFVSGGTANPIANKLSISQLKANLQNNFYTENETDILLSRKQDELTAGNGISIEQVGLELVISATATGGGAPTLTWYKNNTGTAVTIADTSSATLVKVYKNGLLLEPTADYSINETTLTLETALISTDKICLEVF